MSGAPRSANEFGVTTERLDGRRYVVALAGEVDLFSAPELERELNVAIDVGGRELVVDLTETTFADSTFLGVVLRARERLAGCGGELSIVCDDPRVGKIFAITGLDRLFSIAASREVVAGGWAR